MEAIMVMRTVEISTDVYAAIWADRKPGEDSENEIIARKFKVPLPAPQASGRVGWADPRFGVSLMSGEEVFRVYKGKERRAKAFDGFLVLDDGTKCNSLNQLSRKIGAGIENAWQNWYVTGPDGKRQLITARRTK
jgi:hypothetical protein